MAFDVADDSTFDVAGFRIGDRIDQPRKEPQVNTGILHHFIQYAFERFRLERHPAIELAMEKLRHDMWTEIAALMHALDEFFHEAANEHALAIRDRPKARNEAGRAHTAKTSGCFDEQYFGA